MNTRFYKFFELLPDVVNYSLAKNIFISLLEVFDSELYLPKIYDNIDKSRSSCGNSNVKGNFINYDLFLDSLNLSASIANLDDYSPNDKVLTNQILGLA